MKLPKLDGRRALTARRGWALAIVVAAVAGSAVGTVLAVQRPASSAAAPELQAQVVWPAGAKPAPNFALRDQDGKLVTLASERGRPVLVTFLDSRCKRECPVEGRTLADVQRRTAASGASSWLSQRGQRMAKTTFTVGVERSAKSMSAGTRDRLRQRGHEISSPVRSRKPVLMNTTRFLAAAMQAARFTVVRRSSSMMPIFRV